MYVANLIDVLKFESTTVSESNRLRISGSASIPSTYKFTYSTTLKFENRVAFFAGFFVPSFNGEEIGMCPALSVNHQYLCRMSRRKKIPSNAIGLDKVCDKGAENVWV